MNIWIDVLTPKQVLFFEPLMYKLREQGHEVFMTSRHYREAEGLIKLRGLRVKFVGKHGGESLKDKLEAECDRIWYLTKLIPRYNIDLAISMHNPYCARVCFGLGIKHWMFTNAPHHDKVMRLSVPLADKLFIPKHIDKDPYLFLGKLPHEIIQYNSFDEWVLINDIKPVEQDLSRLGKCIVIRTVESKASYELRDFDLYRLIQSMMGKFPKHCFVLLPRYKDEVRRLQKKYQKHPQKIIVMDEVVDSRAILNQCDVFVGSGGTMTTEAVLRGIPTLSMNTAPNDDEGYLVGMDMLPRAETDGDIIKGIRKLLTREQKSLFKMRANTLMENIVDPHSELLKEIKKERD